MLVTKPIDLALLTREMAAASVPLPFGLTLSGILPGTTADQNLMTTDETRLPVELPPEAVPVVNAHTAPPLVVEFAGSTQVDAITRTTDATPKEVFRFPCELKHVYRANLVITGVDAGNGATKVMDGRFVWKRWAAGAIMTGITVVSDLHDSAAASWAPNALPQGNDVVFTVAGAAGRTIDWLLVGEVQTYAPDGLGVS